MSLLREIQGDLSATRGDVTTVLRKARILAARLRNEAFDEWVHRELNGYPHDRAVLPSYRILSVNSKAYLVFGPRHWTEAPVMATLIPEQFREWGTTSYLFESVSHYAALTASARGDTMFKADWPQELAVRYGWSGYSHAQCLGAWQEISPASFVTVVETVRNKLLDFVLEIEAESPDAGEAIAGAHPVPPERVQELANYFFGPVGNVAQSSQGFTQVDSNGAPSEDLARLVSILTEHLSELNLDRAQGARARAQVATLEAQLQGDPDPVIVQQAGRTLRSILEGAIGSLIATAAQPAVWATVQGLLTRFPR